MKLANKLGVRVPIDTTKPNVRDVRFKLSIFIQKFIFYFHRNSSNVANLHAKHTTNKLIEVWESN